MEKILSGLWHFALWGFQRTPLIGRIALAKRSSLKASLIETIIGTLFSTLPIWFFPLVISNMIKGSPSTGELMYNSVKRGDLFIYSAALMGPLIYTITKNYAQLADEKSSDRTSDNAGPVEETASVFGRITFEFPYGAAFVITAILVCMVAAISYGISNLSEFPNSGLTLSSEFLVRSSFYVYIFSLVCLFSVSTYREELSTLSKNLPEDERDFFKRWKARE